jgi:hypothetical protein
MASNNIPTQLPKLKVDNWDRWNVQMQAISGFQDISEGIYNGTEAIGDEATEAT